MLLLKRVAPDYRIMLLKRVAPDYRMLLLKRVALTTGCCC